MTKTIQIKHRFTNAVLFAHDVADDDQAPMRTTVVVGAAGGANLRGADLRGAPDLTGAYLASARNLPPGVAALDPPEPYVRRPSATAAERALRYRELHPEVPVVDQLDAKILERIAAVGALRMETWHTCETTHCRGGWAITIAGDAGRDLERKVGTPRAAQMIYLASTGSMPWFYAPDDVALADIRRCVAEQLAAVTP